MRWLVMLQPDYNQETMNMRSKSQYNQGGRVENRASVYGTSGHSDEIQQQPTSELFMWER